MATVNTVQKPAAIPTAADKGKMAKPSSPEAPPKEAKKEGFFARRKKAKKDLDDLKQEMTMVRITNNTIQTGI